MYQLEFFVVSNRIQLDYLKQKNEFIEAIQFRELSESCVAKVQ